VTAYPARPSIPARPAVYIRDRDATATDDAGITALRDALAREVQDKLGWPAPAVYADAGPPGSQKAALAGAITAGRHDGVFAAHVETAIALQIALATGEFRAGHYVRYDQMLSTCRWKRAEA
jgi:hypothetical protein